MCEVMPTAAERAAEQFGAAALQRAVAAVQADGCVVSTRWSTTLTSICCTSA